MKMRNPGTISTVKVAFARLPTAKPVRHREPWIKAKVNRRAYPWLWAVIGVLLSSALSTAEAGTIPPFVSAMEAMLDATIDDYSFRPRIFGPSLDPLMFASQVDPLGQSFSMATVPGSVYNGLPLTQSITGTYNQALMRWDFIGSGQVGGSPLNPSGYLIYTANDAQEGFGHFSVQTSGGFEFDIESSHFVLWFDPPKTGVSLDSFQYTINGAPVSPQFTITDAVDKNEKLLFDGPFEGSATNDPVGGAGCS
uniref:Uncharacterized protein n=1 Tax=Solibacter usitatus (strain Ellin6076) TaxID=234267 RepID=Q01RJ3_SOLUE